MKQRDKKYAIAIVDGYQFKVYENLEIELIGEKENEVDDSIPDYVQEGLIVLYDGTNNTGNGHSNNVTNWKNLAPISEANQEGANDGTLMNIDFTTESGWTDNSLILDGVDDWVKISYIYYENMTIEIVAKPLDINTTKHQYYIANVQNGGLGICNLNTNNNGSMAFIQGYQYTSSEYDTKVGKVYSMSTGYDGTNVYFNENDDLYKTEITGVNTKPDSATVYAIGTNPTKTTENLLSGEARSNIEVYSVRIYNRCLTEEEIKYNYAIDKERFQIEPIAIEQIELGYVKNGLVCLYDGENNTGEGQHSDTATTWKNIAPISEGTTDGELMNVNYTQDSGWTQNSLILDGIDDWVRGKYFHYPTMTIEIAMKSISSKEGKIECYLGNIESGGIAIQKEADGSLKSWTYVSGYQKLGGQTILTNHTNYSMSTRYNGRTNFFSVNGETKSAAISGTIGGPGSNTVFGIGVNTFGNHAESTGGTYGARSNIEVYCVRIYNRALAQKEVLINYETDKKRFGI